MTVTSLLPCVFVDSLDERDDNVEKKK